MFSNIFFEFLKKNIQKKYFFCLSFIIKTLHLQNQIVSILFLNTNYSKKKEL